MITFTDARNPKWANAANTVIEIEVDWDHVPDEVYPPCALWDADGQPGEEHIADLWNRAVNNEFGPITEFEVPADLDEQETMRLFDVYEIRGNLLLDSDIAILPDRWEAMTPEKQQEWRDYRQALRDVPQNWTMRATYDVTVDRYRVAEEFTFPRAPDS